MGSELPSKLGLDPALIEGRGNSTGGYVIRSRTLESIRKHETVFKAQRSGSPPRSLWSWTSTSSVARVALAFSSSLPSCRRRCEGARGSASVARAISSSSCALLATRSSSAWMRASTSWSARCRPGRRWTAAGGHEGGGEQRRLEHGVGGLVLGIPLHEDRVAVPGELRRAGPCRGACEDEKPDVGAAVLAGLVHLGQHLGGVVRGVALGLDHDVAAAKDALGGEADERVADLAATELASGASGGLDDVLGPQAWVMNSTTCSSNVARPRGLEASDSFRDSERAMTSRMYCSDSCWRFPCRSSSSRWDCPCAWSKSAMTLRTAAIGESSFCGLMARNTSCWALSDALTSRAIAEFWSLASRAATAFSSWLAPRLLASSICVRRVVSMRESARRVRQG